MFTRRPVSPSAPVGRTPKFPLARRSPAQIAKPGFRPARKTIFVLCFIKYPRSPFADRIEAGGYARGCSVETFQAKFGSVAERRL